jgi:hypothetical protein
MKKLLFMLGLPVLLTACQDDDLLSVQSPALEGDGNVNITLSTDGAITQGRSISAADRNSAAGGLTNVDMDNYDLRYQLAIYAINTTEETTDDGTVTTTSYDQVVEPQVRTVGSYRDVTYSFNLTPGKKYRAVAWADFVEAGSTSDLHYDTSDLSAITCLDDNDSRLNDESRDAYAVAQDFEVASSQFTLNLELKRLFAKLRIITTDWNVAGVEKPDQIKLTYNTFNEGTTLNIVETSCKYSKTTRTLTVDLAEDKDYGLNYDAADCNRTIAVDYQLMAGIGYSYVHFDIEGYKDGNLLAKRTVDTDIPLRSNWLTTVMGNLFSSNGEITVECTEDFDNENNRVINNGDIEAVEPSISDNNYYVSSAAQLLWISENATKLSDANVYLTADIDLDGIQWQPITAGKMGGNGAISTIALFDGQGHTIYNLYINKGWFNQDNSGSSRQGLFGSASAITIKNVTLQNVSIDYGYSFVGGIVGELGSCGGDNLIENCNVYNFFSRPILYNFNINAVTMNCGAIVGIMDCGTISNCTVDNADIQNGWRAAGMVGFCNYLNNGVHEMKFSNCSVSNASLWNFYDGTDDEDMLRQVGAIVGLAWGAGETTDKIYFDNCSSSNITYKYLGSNVIHYNDDDTYYYEFMPLFQQKSGDEGKLPTVTYHDINFICGAETALYGRAADVTPVVTNASAAESQARRK